MTGRRTSGGEQEVPSDETVLRVGRDVLYLEASTIEAVAAHLGDSFFRSVNLIHESVGRVIVTGIGKSGLVGRKIAATMASTGSPAHFVHATEALHGDSGVVQAEDVMITLSNSGETWEVVAFARLVLGRGTTVIAMTGSVDSTLGRLAQEVLEVPCEREADPHDLAPTTSTTAAMALGDALSVALMTVSGHRAEDFFANHPEGSLGNQR